jgi:hypothetical protein
MPETETPFNPLDSLGPEYGGINQPNADEISYKPFEGDRIKMPEINFSASPIPSFTSLTQPQLNIKNTITGNPPGKPGSKPGQSTNDIASAFIDYSKSLAQANQDKNSYARMYSYNAGPSGNNFFKRYNAYGQEKFDEIGFSPIRDNEAIFNERTTKWNDYTRMMNHSFMPLAVQGFMSGPKSLWKMAHGDFTSSDLEDANMYEEAAAIGQSTKGGAFGFMNNTFMNFGYTAGIITEIMAEEAGAALIGAGLTATGVGAPEGVGIFAGTTARNIARLGAKAPMIGKFITKADDVFRGTVKALESSDNARAFWKASQTKVGSFLNPLSNTFTAVNGIRTAEKFDNLTGLAKMSKTAGGFYMDVKSLNGALSEARLEGGMAENKVYQNLYDKYYKEHGETPTNDQQYEMVKQSKLAGLETVGWNTALIYASNKISFGNILNRKGGLSNMLGSKTKEVLNLKTGNVVVKDVKAAGSKIVKGEFSFLENKFKNTLEILKTQGVAKLSKGAATYMKANLAEGLQENAQETISQALEGYYTDSFNSKAVTSHLYARGATMMASKGDYFSKAWGEQNPFTEKGFETFATGFVMGGFAAPLNSLPGWANTGYNRIFKPEEFTKYKELRNTYGASVGKELTDLSSDPIDFFESKIFNLGNQEIMDKIKQSGGRKESLDATDQAFVSQISTALKTDTFDRFKDQLASYKNLTAEEFEAEFPSIPKGEGAKYIARIDGILTKANEIQKSYKEINDRFPSPIDLSKYEEGTDAYKKAAIFHSAWEGAKQNAIFMGQGYKDAVARMNQIKNTLQANKPLSKMTDTELQVLIEPSRLANERELLRTEIESQRGILPAAEIAKKEVKLKALEDLSEAFAYYEKYEVIDKEGRIAKLKAEGRFKGLKDAEGNEITEAEAEAEAREIVNRSLKIKSRTKENTQEAQDRLESAYKNYLKAVASIHSDTYIERDADAAFDLLLDSYKLGKEATILAGHVNMLHNPREFISHVEKNYTWMNDLYNNRREYYDGLVNQEINNIELNALLNELAEKNIYISADDAAEFQRSGRLPSEFFDETRKAVIKEGHPEYNIYAQLFERANSVRTFNPNARAADSTALNLALAKLNAEMQNEINSLPKTETIEELGKISLGGKESISIKVLDEQMEVEDFVDAEYMSGKKRKKVTFFKSKEGLRYDNQTGDLVNIERFSEKFVAGRKYKTSLKPDAAEVAKVEKVYAEKRLEIINKLNEKAKTEKLTQVAKYIPFTVNTPLEQMDDDLYTALTTAFSDYITDEDRENEVEQMNPEDLREILEDFIKNNPAAKDVIDNYNKKKIDQLISDQIEEIEAPVLNINGEVVNFELLDVKTIKSNVSKLEKNLEKLTNKPEEERTAADKEAIALLEFDLTLANKYLSYKLNIKDSPKRAAVLKKIRKLLDEQNDIELDRVKNKYIVKGKEQEFERVTNATQKLLSSHYKYPDTAIITEVYDATIGKGGTIDDFMKALRAKKGLKGFSKWTFTEVENELKTRTGEETQTTTTDTVEGIEKRREEELAREFKGVNLSQKSIDTIAERTDAKAIAFIDKYDKINAKYDAEIDDLESNTPTTDTKADIERRRQEVERVSKLPFQERIPALIKSGIIASNATFNLGKRFPIIVNIAGVKVAFYRSSEGTGGKQKGAWTPMFGFGEDKGNPWLIKGNIDTQVNVNYNSAAIKEYADILNKTLNWEHDLDKGQVKNHPYYNVLSLVENELAFNKELYGKKDLGIINGQTDVSGYINSKLQEINAKYDTELAALESTPTTKRKATLNEVLALVTEKTYEDRRIAGIYVDAQIRNFLAGVEVKKDSTMIDDDAFDALFGADSVLSSLKEQVDNGDLIAIPNNIKLYDENSGIAGEIDLLFIDREGKVFIVDIKTGKKDKWDNYDEPTNRFSPKQGYSLQLTAYKNMLYNMYGIEATIGILPIQITTDSETGKVLSVKRADGVLKPDRGTFKIDANEESIVSIDANENVNYGKTFQQLVDTIIPRITPTGETIEEVPLTPEDEEIKKEVKKLTAEQKKSQDRNMGILISKIQTLRERQALLDEDVSKINDTLKFLDTILNQSIDLTTEDVIGLINNITSLDKVTGQLIKSKLTKRGGKIQLRAKDLRAQLRREFAIANDITNRINELKREKERILEPLKQDLKKQADYYQSLLDDPNMSLYNAAEIKQKIDTVKRKISTIEKLITIIQNAISKSIAYLKEYVKIWEKSNKNYEKFKKETGYKALSSEEIKSLIDSVDSADKATLENYPDLTKEFNKLESNVLDAMDSVELLEDVKAEETSRLNQLQGALQKYDDQLRYLNELLEPRSKDSLDNRLSDRNSEGPKPTEVKKASAENKKQTVEAIQRSKDDKVLSTFSLADIADLGDVVTGEQAVNKDLRSKLDSITKAKTTEEITELSKDLKDFKPGEIKMILDVVKERLQELTKEFKEEVKDQLDTTLGAEYVTINPIGDIPAGTLVVISEVVGDNVTVAIVNSNKKKSIKFGKLIGNVMTPAQAKESAVAQTIDITKEVTDVLQTSKTAADNLSDSTIDKIIGDVDSLKLSDLEEDLFNMEIC